MLICSTTSLMNEWKSMTNIYPCRRVMWSASSKIRCVNIHCSCWQLIKQVGVRNILNIFLQMWLWTQWKRNTHIHIFAFVLACPWGSKHTLTHRKNPLQADHSFQNNFLGCIFAMVTENVCSFIPSTSY